MQIHWAAKRGDNAAIQRLLRRGVKPDAIDGALGWAVKGTKAGLPTLQLLITHGANVNVVGAQRQDAPLTFAAEAGRPAIVRFLLEAGANPRFVDASNYTAITNLPAYHDAAHLEILELLLQSGADPNVVSIHGESPLTKAFQWGNCNAIRLLLRHGADRDLKEVPPLAWAVVLGSVEDVTAELDSENDPTRQGYCDPFSWLLSVMMGDVPKAEVLLANGAILETRGQVGWSGLMHAACRGHAEMTHWLISQGADLQAFNVLKETALTLAAQFGNTDCVRILLEAGAPMRHGRSHPAIARAGNTEVVRLLVDAGADIDARGDNNFAWPLKVAAESDDIQFARQLLDMGADVNRDSIGETALHTAAKRDHLEIVSLLLQRGANPDASDCDMYTPLMYAESLECINLLLAAGADIHAFDCAGAEVVRHYEDPEFIDRLLALGATWDEEKPYP